MRQFNGGVIPGRRSQGLSPRAGGLWSLSFVGAHFRDFMELQPRNRMVADPTSTCLVFQSSPAFLVIGEGTEWGCYQGQEWFMCIYCLWGGYKIPFVRLLSYFGFSKRWLSFPPRFLPPWFFLLTIVNRRPVVHSFIRLNPLLARSR